MDGDLSEQIRKHNNLVKNYPDFSIFKHDDISSDRDTLKKLYDFVEESSVWFNQLMSNADFSSISRPEDFAAIYDIIGHGPTNFNVDDKNKKRLTGLLGPMLNDAGEKIAILNNKNYSGTNLVFSSSIPRALHHTILRCLPNKHGEIKKIAETEVSKDGVISPEGYNQLIDFASDLDIIVTPLLAAQYFSFLEGFNKSSATEKQSEESIWRRQLANSIRNSNGEYVGEPYTHFAFERGFVFLEHLANEREGIIIPQADIITHSGFFDIAKCWFRYLESSEISLARTEASTKRGESAQIILDENRVYINDEQKLDAIKEKTRKKIKELRNRSLDERIRDSGKGLVNTPLIGYKNDENHTTFNASTITALKSEEPTIIFGHGGQGKTIFATNIAEKIMGGDLHYQYDQYKNYIPLLLNCEDLNRDIRLNGIGDNAAAILELIKKDISELPDYLLENSDFLFLIDDYQKVRQDYRESVKTAIEQLAKKDKVFIFSRLERDDIKPPINEGYLTLQINERSFNVNSFIESRISEEKQEDFHKYISKYDSSITGNYITLYALTLLFEHPERIVEYFDGVEHERLVGLIESNSSLNRPQLYEVETQFVLGNQIERENSSLSKSEVIQTISEEKKKLANLAYNKWEAGKNESSSE